MATRKKGSVENAPTEPRPVHEADKSKHKRKATLSKPMVKLNAGDSYNLEINSVSARLLPGNSSVKTQAVLLDSVNMDTGEEISVIAPSVLCSTLGRAFGELPEFDEKSKEPTTFQDGTTWDGKKIEIECSKREGKRYMDVAVWELE